MRWITGTSTQSADNEFGDYGSDDEDEEDKDREEKKTIKERLQTIQDVSQTVQNTIGHLASLGESVKKWVKLIFLSPSSPQSNDRPYNCTLAFELRSYLNHIFISSFRRCLVHSTFNFSVSELSWLAVILLILACLVLHYIPIRFLLLFWGCVKFSRRLLRPHTVPNNEVLDLLSRVPDDDQLVCQFISKPINMKWMKMVSYSNCRKCTISFFFLFTLPLADNVQGNRATHTRRCAPQRCAQGKIQGCITYDGSMETIASTFRS